MKLSGLNNAKLLGVWPLHHVSHSEAKNQYRSHTSHPVA